MIRRLNLGQPGWILAVVTRELGHIAQAIFLKSLVSVISDAVPHRVEAAARRSGSHMVRNYSCCTVTANYLFVPYLSIYSLVALVSLYRPEYNH